MTSYNTDYRSLSKEDADIAALKDIESYLGEEKYQNLVKGVELDYAKGELSAERLNFLFGIAGISGYPFHAFARKYMLDSYRGWMHSGEDAVQTDEKGYTI